MPGPAVLTPAHMRLTSVVSDAVPMWNQLIGLVPQVLTDVINVPSWLLVGESLTGVSALGSNVTMMWNALNCGLGFETWNWISNSAPGETVCDAGDSTTSTAATATEGRPAVSRAMSPAAAARTALRRMN